MKTFRANSSHRGFTLIELMIALLIGVFLMAGVIQIFLSAKQAYRLQENLSRLQENGRFAMDIFTKNVRMAGYTGCASKVIPNVIAKPRVPAILAIGTSVEGKDNIANNWDTTVCGANECVAGTDVISLQSATSCQAQLTGNMNVVTAELQINPACTPTQINNHDINCNTCGIEANQIVIVSNCSNTDIFAATTASNGGAKQTITHANNVNTDNNLSTKYGTDAEIFSPQLMSYYIRTGTGGIPALWSINNAKTGAKPVELIEGIENMQILYGVDTPDATTGNYDYVPNYYVIAPSVTDWTKVVSVRISLLAVTIENNLTDTPQPYFYNGTTTTPTDYKIRRVFSSTIAVRNRLLY